MKHCGRLILVGLVCSIDLSYAAGSFELGPAPTAPTPEQIERLRQLTPPHQPQSAAFEVDITSREAVRNLFNAVYAASEPPAPKWEGWNGNTTNCTPGTTAGEFRDAVGRRINYFRAMAGIPAGVTLDDLLHAKTQEAALMMSANGALSHFPPDTWTCYTEDGAEAAGNSNIAIGNHGPDAINGYIEDHGSGNAAVGHRRWLLYPQTQIMATGDIPRVGDDWNANSTWVFDGNFSNPRPATRDGFVSWPPPGYVPYQVVYPRWSISDPNADFSQATVTLSSNAVSVPVTLEPIFGNRGENTLVWYPSALNTSAPYDWPRPNDDDTWSVTVENVDVGYLTNFSYNVTLIDPAVPGPDTVIPEITGPDQPPVGTDTSYTFETVTSSSGHQWRQARPQSLTIVEDAENGLADFDSYTSSLYDVIIDNPEAPGTSAFHLVQPEKEGQWLRYQRILLPGDTAELRFKSRLGWATPNQVAHVQVSLDAGTSWQDIYVQAGSDGRGETQFQARTVSLTDFSNRSIQLRFNYDYAGGLLFTNIDTGVGWHLDDIAFTAVDELTEPNIANVPPGDTFVFTPTSEGDYVLQARAVLFDEFPLEWGPAKHVTASSSVPPVITLLNPPVVDEDHHQITIEFEVNPDQPGLTFELLRASILDGIWTSDSATFDPPEPPNVHYRANAQLPAGADHLFYLIRVNGGN